MNDLLQTVNVSKQFGGQTKRLVLNRVNLTLPENTLTALIGDSGGGKTTLCRILIGLEAPDSGQVIFKGKKLGLLKQRSFAECASIQYIFQDPYAALDTKMNVKDTLAEPVRLCRKHRRSFLSPEEALDLVGLKQTQEMPVSSLSGGQRQLVAIARAIITHPELIIADESTSMLDQESARAVNTVFNRIRQEKGVSFLLVTHNADMIFSLCDRICVFNEGSIIEAGNPLQISMVPKNPYTRKYMESIKEIEGGEWFEQNCLCQS